MDDDEVPDRLARRRRARHGRLCRRHEHRRGSCPHRLGARRDDERRRHHRRDDRIDPAAAIVEDASGPCDEAEHANDPRCTGASASTPAPAQAPAATTADDPNEDVSGPCDEAEHANDPRCTGGAAAEDDDHGDNSGRGGHDDGAEDRSGHGGGDDDRSGSNSGKG